MKYFTDEELLKEIRQGLYLWIGLPADALKWLLAIG